MQGGKRQGVGNGLAEPGEMGLVWVMKGLEKFGHYSALSGSHSCLSNGISFYVQSYAEFQTTHTKKMIKVELIWLKQGRFQSIAHLNVTLTPHHGAARKAENLGVPWNTV